MADEYFVQFHGLPPGGSDRETSHRQKATLRQNERPELTLRCFLQTRVTILTQVRKGSNYSLARSGEKPIAMIGDWRYLPCCNATGGIVSAFYETTALGSVNRLSAHGSQETGTSACDSEGVLETGLSDCERGIDFGYNKDEIEGVPVDEIPAIRMELCVHLFDEVCRPIKVECLLSPCEHAQQSIETDEMIDVGGRDKDMLQTVDLSRRQTGKIAQVEEHGMFFEERFDIEGRIAFPPI